MLGAKISDKTLGMADVIDQSLGRQVPTPPEPDTEEARFVWRRAFRKGRVRRADVMQAFGVADTTATNVLKEAVASSSGWLIRKPKWVEPCVELAETPPHWASAADLLDALDAGEIGFWRTGLDGDQEELSVQYTSWTRRRPLCPRALDSVVMALVGQRLCEIEYVGLRHGERARWRRVLPHAFERVGDEWRLVAEDIDAVEKKARSYVLAQIVGARALSLQETRQRLGRDHWSPAPWDSKVDVPLSFSDRLTDDQKRVLRHKLRILRDQDKVRLPSRSVGEFFMRFACRSPDEADLVWPFLDRTD